MVDRGVYVAMKHLAWLVTVAGLAVSAVKRWRARPSETRPAWPCALHGHNDLLIFGEAGRVFLRCDTCGYETPGWCLVRAKELV